MTVKRKLFDLAGADEGFRFSPYCWRIKLALAHKNLTYETVPWRFTDKAAIAFAGTTKVPVLVDGSRTITDSQEIAEYLETEYAHEASLFGDPPSKSLTRFIKAWVEETLHPLIGRVVVPVVYERLAPQDRAYFLESREAMFGMSFAQLTAERAQNMALFTAALKPVRKTLRQQQFLAGTAPSYADHALYGAMIWAQLTMPALLSEEPEILAWMKAVLATYGL